MNINKGIRNVSIAFALLNSVMVALADECNVRVGEYSGTVKAEWLVKTREMKLLEPFAFKGPDCKSWPVPKGALVDGASIPQVFWSVIGGPFEGRYRDASVVHDYYCKIKSEPWEKVHDMFYDAMLANGVDSNKAALMFYAVRWFGPKWVIKLKSPSVLIGSASYTFQTLDPEIIKSNSQFTKMISVNTGQPAPVNIILPNKFILRTENNFENNSSWLVNSSNVAIKTFENTPNPYKILKPTIVDIETADTNFEDIGTKLRVVSYVSSLAPSTAEIERLKAWIERENPTLDDLKKTQIQDIPENKK